MTSPAKPRSGLRQWLGGLNRPLVQTVYFVALLGLAAYALLREQSDLPALFGRLDWSLVALAGGALVAATLFYVFVQHTIYRGVGVRLTFLQVFSIVCPSQLGKYVPGKVLMAGNYYLLSRRVGVEAREIGSSFLVSTALWIVSAVLCSLPGFASLSPGWRLAAILLAVVLLASTHPRALGLIFRALAWALRKAKRGSTAERLGEPFPLPYAFYLRTLGLYLVAWVLVGLQVYWLVAAVAPVGPVKPVGLSAMSVLPVCLAAGAIGTVAGFVALFAPGGLGVREGLGAVILARVVPAEPALLAFVLLRLMTVVVDLAFGGLGLLIGHRILKRGAGDLSEDSG